MLIPQFTILYVANPAHSTLFYRELFGFKQIKDSTEQPMLTTVSV